MFLLPLPAVSVNFMGTLTASPSSEPNTKVLTALDCLPPFPAVALKAMTVLSGTDTSLSELCDLIRSDPAFSGEILRIANSPLIAFSKEITSVLQASMLLGFRRLRRVVITVGLRSYLDKSFTPAMRACWRHSVASAMIAERIARWNSVDRDSAHTAGILHDIGRMALATVEPGLYAGLIEKAAIEPAFDVLQAERDLFGIDHCGAGRLLAIAWKLPEVFVDITSRHHEPLSRLEDVVEVVRLSCLLADALGFAATPRQSMRSSQEVLAEYPESVRKNLPTADLLTDEITREMSVIEAA